jgi:SNF2 family DNA or RNA helicase
VIIDVQNNKIMIYDRTNELGTVEKSQLSFWKFKYDYPNSSYSIALDKHLFLKIVAYFEKEGKNFELSSEAHKYSEEIEIISLNYERIKRIAAQFKNGIIDENNFEEFRKFVLGNIRRSLKSHQLKAAYHLYLLKNGANFSVPGSGKTSVVLTVYEKLRLEGKVNTLFVVGPPSCFGPWRNEFKETLGRIPVYSILAGGNRVNRKSQYYEIPKNTPELYLITFQTLLSDQSEIDYFLKQKHLNIYFVIDEAHYIKQINGSWAQATLRQSEKAKCRCVLTGTPMPKSYSDTFNLFDFLWPNQYPISSSNKTLIKINEERNNRHTVKHILDESIGPLFYRVRKSDLNLAPQNMFVPKTLTMNKYERFIYDAIYKRIRDFSKKEYFNNIDFINKLGRGRIMRLRQAVSYVKLLNTAVDSYDENLLTGQTDLKSIIRQYDGLEIPSKIEYLIKQIKQLHRDKLKVVIWSNFILTIKLIEKHLKLEGYNCKIIYGDTPIEGTNVKDEETRERIRDEFVDPRSGLDILIANPAACAESISLHKTCHHAIYYDLSYNCAQYLQSLDRIHRVGGSETTEANYYYLQYKNTIDVDIKRNIDDKTYKMFEIIEEDYPIYSLNMTEADGDAEAYKRIFMREKL